MDPGELQQTVASARKYGWVVCDWRARAERGAASSDELDAYCKTVGLGSMGEDGGGPDEGGWNELSGEEARRMLVYLLRHDMAYQAASDVSADVLEPFFDVFSKSARQFTSAVGIGTSSSWGMCSKTKHTFDAGVVVVDDVTIGLVWFADED